jgi:hypothetical protein
MFTSRKVVQYMTAEPFRPFRIKMASGQAIEILDPEMILVGRSSVGVCTVTGDEQNEKWHDASLMLMESLEPIESPQAISN